MDYMSSSVASFRWPLAPWDHSYVSLCMLSKLTLAKHFPSWSFELYSEFRPIG